MGFGDVLRVLSMLSAGAFGTIGITTKSVDENGRLTKWGRVAISGVGLSTLLSVIIFGLDAHHAALDAQKNEKRFSDNVNRQAAILGNVEAALRKQDENLKTSSQSLRAAEAAAYNASETLNRAATLQDGMTTSLLQQRTISRATTRLLRPLQLRGFEIVLDYAMDDPRFRAYSERVEVALRAKGVSTEPGDGASHSERFAEISRSPDLLPSPKDGEAAAWLFLSHSNVLVSFRAKRPLRPFDPPDLRFQAVAAVVPRAVIGPSGSPSTSTVSLAFNFTRRLIRQHVRVRAMDKEVDNGRFSSFADLPGSILSVTFTSDDNMRGPLPKMSSLVLYEGEDFAKGYALPASKFVPNPDDPAALAYRTTETDFGV